MNDRELCESQLKLYEAILDNLCKVIGVAPSSCSIVELDEVVLKVIASLTKERDEARAQRDELEAIKHAEERPIRTELRLLRVELSGLREEHADKLSSYSRSMIECDTLRAEVKRLGEKVARYDEAATLHENNWLQASAERDDYKAQLDELVEATILGPLKGKTAHDEIVSLRAQLEAAWMQIKEMQERM
jgi:uncharacterized coiled-coil DUF342 family protein